MTIEEQIRRYVADNFLFSDNECGLAQDTSFLEEGIIDSTGVLELVMFVEETFNLTVEDNEIVPENLDSIAQLAAYIRRKLTERPLAAPPSSGAGPGF